MTTVTFNKNRKINMKNGYIHNYLHHNHHNHQLYNCFYRRNLFFCLILLVFLDIFYVAYQSKEGWPNNDNESSLNIPESLANSSFERRQQEQEQQQQQDSDDHLRKENPYNIGQTKKTTNTKSLKEYNGKSHIIYLPNDKTYNAPPSYYSGSPKLTTTTKTTTSSSNRPTFLFGIPSLAKRWERRQLIRDTYLSTYREYNVRKTKDYNYDRICFVGNYTPNCQVAYAFFIGRHPPVSSKESNEDTTTFIPTELLEPNETYPISVPLTESLMDELGLDKHHDTDVVVLNIRENQMDGKMPTWFKYASIINNSTDNGPIFDYIAKVDDDTLVLVPNFLEYMKTHLPKTTNNNKNVPRRIYGGRAFDSSFCDPAAPDGHDHPCPLPLVSLQDTHANYHDLYMSGELSFMSWDLARDFTDTTVIPNERRKNVTIRQHEDVSLSNYVFSVVIPPPLQPLNGNNAIVNASDNNNDTNSSFDTISVLKIPKRTVLIKDRLAQFGIRITNPFSKSLWCHSVSSNGGYFKDEDNVRDFWKQYINAWKNNFKKDVPRDPYQLVDPITTKMIDSMNNNKNGDLSSSSLLLHPRDYIYRNVPSQPDTSPVILQKYKLIFFIVPGAGDRIWKNVLLRMQIDAGEAIPLTTDTPVISSHTVISDKNRNNELSTILSNQRQLQDYQQQQQYETYYRLKRLNDFSITEANDIMTNNQYTLAMMVRDPTERLIDIYENYISANSTERTDWIKKYCGNNAPSFDIFLNIIDHCRHILWRPQGQRMEPKYNFNNNNNIRSNIHILHYNNNAKDDEMTFNDEIKGLFQRIGAWEEYGDGGGVVDVSNNNNHNDDNLFSLLISQLEEDKKITTAFLQRRHVQEELKYPILKRVQKSIYHWDYNHPLFHFSLK